MAIPTQCGNYAPQVQGLHERIVLVECGGACSIVADVLPVATTVMVGVNLCVWHGIGLGAAA